MNYKIITLILFMIFLNSCDQSIINKSNKKDFQLEKKYKNSGFALIYDSQINEIKKLEKRSLLIYHKSLKKNSTVKITNPLNGKYLIANVKSNKVKFSNFYNSVLSLRIAEELELDLNEPFIELILVSKNSTFVAKKTKMFEEEKTVAEKAPVDGIQIKDLNVKKNEKKKTKSRKFSYIIKVADFYYIDSAKLMINRIKNETSLKNLMIIKLYYLEQLPIRMN